ncbi:MAG: formate/nitrite transporter family protein [Actinomycetota bacterium]|nr:formate/nitrite transporter family protein [Actinomycetota bacterium]
MECLGLFLPPSTLGNIVGGLVLVTLLNYGQVAGSKEGSPAEAMGEQGR